MYINSYQNTTPEVALVIVQSGASAKTMASNIAVPVEEKLWGLILNFNLYSPIKTSGFELATLRSTRAGPSGLLLPCSQFLSVATEILSMLANSFCV